MGQHFYLDSFSLYSGSFKFIGDLYSFNNDLLVTEEEKAMGWLLFLNGPFAKLPVSKELRKIGKYRRYYRLRYDS